MSMKIISFNSYKGGACRTTTCYNTLPYLAKGLGATSRQPILVFDIDLDSMGLTSIFHEGIPATSQEMPYSAKHLFVDDGTSISREAINGIQRGMPEEYYKHFEKVGEDLGLEDDGSVLFLGADRNAATITDSDYKKFANNSPINEIIRELKDLDEDKMPKAIVFDCASGVQMTTLVALQQSDCAVVCMRPTYQFRVGTADYILRQIPNEIDKNTSSQKRKVVLLPTAVAQVNVPSEDPNCEAALSVLNNRRKKAFISIEKEIVDQYENENAREFGKLSYVLNTEMLSDREDGVRGLPEVERFKWQEELLYKLSENEMTLQEKSLKRKYEKLAKIIAE